jgi:hypothetical protein
MISTLSANESKIRMELKVNRSLTPCYLVLSLPGGSWHLGQSSVEWSGSTSLANKTKWKLLVRLCPARTCRESPCSPLHQWDLPTGANQLPLVVCDWHGVSTIFSPNTPNTNFMCCHTLHRQLMLSISQIEATQPELNTILHSRCQCRQTVTWELHWSVSFSCCADAIVYLVIVIELVHCS